MKHFTVLISVYKNDRAPHVKASIESIIHQTCVPSEILLIVDGPIDEDLSNLIAEYETNVLFRVIRLKNNVGLGNVLQIGVKEAKNDLIARMDSDDIAVADRFQKQLLCFEQDDDLSICGGMIAEFVDTIDNIVSYRLCPITDEDIKSYMKRRCGFNHMTVMFKKDAVLKAGNYQDWPWNEDYFLWLRMLIANCKFLNLSDVLCYVRVGLSMYNRRGGIKYFKSEAKLQYYMFRHNIIGFVRLICNITIRFIVQILIPNSIRGWVFQKFARN